MAGDAKKETPLLFSFSNPNQLGLGLFGSSNNPPLPPPPPCVEVLLEEVESVESSLEPIHLKEGLTLLKGRVSTSDVFGVSNSDLVPGKYEGGLKLWEGSLDLIKTLHSEIQNGQLTVSGKRVLELGCGHGLPGIFTCLQGASITHFQDFNVEVLKCLTIPNVRANLAREVHYEQSLATKETKSNVSTKIRFFAGDWSEIHQLLLHVTDVECRSAADSCTQHEPCDGYDIILMAETVYSLSSLENLYRLIKKCLLWPHGVVYLAAKKHYFGVGGGTKQFKYLVEEDGTMDASLLAEVADGSSNVREVWKFSFK